MNEIQLIENKDARETVIGRTEVLDKVKSLPILPDDMHVTASMVAEFYETSTSRIRNVLHRHSDEFESDGVRTIKREELFVYLPYRFGTIEFQKVPVQTKLYN